MTKYFAILAMLIVLMLGSLTPASAETDAELAQAKFYELHGVETQLHQAVDGCHGKVVTTMVISWGAVKPFTANWEQVNYDRPADRKQYWATSQDWQDYNLNVRFQTGVVKQLEAMSNVKLIDHAMKLLQSSGEASIKEGKPWETWKKFQEACEVDPDLKGKLTFSADLDKIEATLTAQEKPSANNPPADSSGKPANKPPAPTPEEKKPTAAASPAAKPVATTSPASKPEANASGKPTANDSGKPVVTASGSPAAEATVTPPATGTESRQDAGTGTGVPEVQTGAPSPAASGSAAPAAEHGGQDAGNKK